MNLKYGILLLSALCYGDGQTTGPSTCNARLIPVATGSNGVILFKTSFKINLSGGSYKEPMEIGWLVASKRGVWEYARHVYLTFDDGVQVTPEDSIHIRKFESSFQFDKADEGLMKLVGKYEINKLINKNTGRDAVSWTKYGIYQNGKRISRSSIVKSIFDLTSNPGKGNPIKASFYHEGVAIFNSQESLDEQSDSTIIKGPEFFNGSKYNGEEVWALYSIDGLVVVDP
jgi:hypothetical protein